jgi:hypothetical protein
LPSTLSYSVLTMIFRDSFLRDLLSEFCSWQPKKMGEEWRGEMVFIFSRHLPYKLLRKFQYSFIWNRLPWVVGNGVDLKSSYNFWRLSIVYFHFTGIRLFCLLRLTDCACVKSSITFTRQFIAWSFLEWKIRGEAGVMTRGNAKVWRWLGERYGKEVQGCGGMWSFFN